jgi:hypothetical protein
MDGEPCTPDDQEKCGIGCHNGPVEVETSSDVYSKRSEDMSNLKRFQGVMSGKRRQFGNDDDEDAAADDWCVRGW